jgi:hypothetical protein
MQRQVGWVHGLPDLAQEHPAVTRYLLTTASHWLNVLRPDGFRLDAVTHLPPKFLRALAVELGTGVERIGEIYDGRAALVAERLKTSGLTTAFDFPLHFALLDVFCGDAPVEHLAAALGLDRLYEHPEGLITFLDNHDTARLMSRCGGDQRRVDQALSALFALRGVPMITYGTEAGLSGDKEPENRADMRFGAAHPSGVKLAELVALRRRFRVLERGESMLLDATSNRLALLRFDTDEAVLVLANRAPTAATLGRIDLPRGLKTTLPLPSALHGYGFAFLPLTVADQPSFTAWLRERRAERLVRFVAKADSGDGLVIVGNAPELGGWKPKEAPKLVARNGVMSAAVRLPGDTMVAFKLARIEAGEVRWSSAANGYALPAALRGDVEVAW